MGVDVLRVLPANGDETNRAPTRLSKEEAQALLESAYLAIAANGDLSDEEADAFRALVPRVLGMSGQAAKAPNDAELRKLFDGFDANLRHAEVPERLTALAKIMTGQELRELAYKLGFALSLCDLATDDDEADFLDALTDAFGLDARVDALTAEVYAALDDGSDEPSDDGPEAA